MTKTMTPPEFDAAEYALMADRAREERILAQFLRTAHQLAGDRQRRGAWEMSDDQAQERLVALMTELNQNAIILAKSIFDTRQQINELDAAIAAMEDVYRAAPWTRWYPCLNADGHIHSDDRGCPTLHRMGQVTAMGWETRLSGQPVEVVIADLGPRLCSVCFPDAPAEHCQSLSDLTRAERQAATAARRDAKAAKDALKNLTRDEARLLGDAAGESVTTVAAAKALVREAAETQVELEWNCTRDAAARWHDPQRHAEVVARLRERLTEKQRAAALAVEILSAREITVPGSGWSRADAAKSVDGTIKRTHKAYFG